MTLANPDSRHRLAAAFALPESEVAPGTGVVTESVVEPVTIRVTAGIDPAIQLWLGLSQPTTCGRFDEKSSASEVTAPPPPSFGWWGRPGLHLATPLL